LRPVKYLICLTIWLRGRATTVICTLILQNLSAAIVKGQHLNLISRFYKLNMR